MTMNKILPIVAALSLAGAAAGGSAALAQAAARNATPTTESAAAAPHGPGGHMEGMRWGHHHGAHDRGKEGQNRLAAPGTFGLFAPQQEKNLSPEDVQQIAQAILLWHGNHDWKVGQVQPGQNHQVTFAYTAQDGTVIAKFAISQDTGRITRVG
jgi:hypothetical protein